jgi:membrane protease YdiL (CAAX protease family)
VKNKRRQLFILFALGFLSLGLISLTDRFFFRLFSESAPFLVAIADLRLTSLFLIWIIWIVTRKRTQPVQIDVNQGSATSFGFRKIAKFSGPVWITAVLFGLQHLGYHGFAINPASLTQVGYTILAGLVFGSLRESSGRLWPAILLHLATNSFTIIRNLV